MSRSKDEAPDVAKSDSVKELSLYISKASLDKKSQQMRGLAVASDIGEDSFGDSMSMELFADFISRIETKESAPEVYCSDYWSGGMPYLSVAHYSDQNGDGIPGEVESIFVDGNRLKEKFILANNSMGLSIFRSIMDDLYSDNPKYDDPVRISIAFLDYKHQHKDGGYVFERNLLSDTCPECLKRNNGKTYLNGHLIHCAFTRVPANPRTEIENLEERSMAKIKTKREDAESLIGDTLAEELELNEKVIGKSETLVVKSEEESEDVTEEVKKSVEKTEDVDIEERAIIGPTSIKDMLGEREATEEINRISDLFYMFSEVVYNIFRSEDVEDKKAKIENATKEFKDMLKAKSMLVESDQDSILTKAWKEFSNALDGLSEDASEEEKLRSIQPAFESLGQAVVESIEGEGVVDEAEVEDGELSISTLSKALAIAVADANKPLLEELSLLKTILAEAPKQSGKIPSRRSMPASLVKQAVTVKTEPKQEKKLSSLSKMINKSVGLDENHFRSGVLIREEK